MFSILKWFWTPCNIYKNERIWNYDYNKVLKNSKSITFAPKIYILNSTREIKSKTFASFEPTTHIYHFHNLHVHLSNAIRIYVLAVVDFKQLYLMKLLSTSIHTL